MKEFASQSFGAVFKSGFDFSAYSEAHGNSNLVLTIATTARLLHDRYVRHHRNPFCRLRQKGNMLTEKGEVPNMEKAMFADAAAPPSAPCAVLPTVTTFAESAAGVAEGGKTGLSSMFTAIFFVAAMLLSPHCSARSLLRHRRRTYMSVCFGRVGQENRLERRRNRRSRFLTMVMMPFAYNISYGIAFGLISYIVIKLFWERPRKSASEHGLSPALFVATLLLTLINFKEIG